MVAGARIAVLALVLLAVACGNEPGARPVISPIPENLDEFGLVSPAFDEGGPIPDTYTCNGENVSPPIQWAGVPDGAVELVLTLLDPDAPAGVFTHWTVYGIDPATTGFPGGAVPEGTSQGLNDFGEIGYRGPCPPEGESHRYVFTLATLAEPSGLEPGASPREVDIALAPATSTTTLTGVYPG